MIRRSRLAIIGNFHSSDKQRFKDHITGEELDTHKVVQRIKEGIYSKYHVKHLKLPAGNTQQLSA